MFIFVNFTSSAHCIRFVCCNLLLSNSISQIGPAYSIVDTTPCKILHKKSYNKMDTGAFLNELMLSQLYNIVSLSDNVQDAWVKWSDQFNSIVNRHVTTKQIGVKTDRIPG